MASLNKISVVLVRPQTSENIGFVARAMANFGFTKLIIIDPQCDPLDNRTAKHARQLIVKAQIAKSLADLRDKYDLIAGTTSVVGTDYNVPRTPIAPSKFSEIANGKNIAIAFGNEGTGLSNQEISQCDVIITIPTALKYPAMNLSHAVAVLLYELFMKSRAKKQGDQIKPASRIEKDIMMEKMESIFSKVEFQTKGKKETQEKVWKRLFEKSMISKREAFAIIGLLNKVDDGLSPGKTE